MKLKNLGWNGIGADGAAAIADMLRHNTSLKEVSLTSNPIGDAGADALTQALTVNTTLKDIRLDGVGHRGLDLIACHLPAMSGLTRITIFDLNGLTPQIVDSFIEALERNTELESVCLRAYNDPDAERLIEGIMPRVNHQMLLNHGGKRILSEHNVLNGLWPEILARSSKEPDVLFYFLRERPGLLIYDPALGMSWKQKLFWLVLVIVCSGLIHLYII